MLKTQTQQYAAQNAEARKRLTQIDTLITEIGNEDLPDISDISRVKSKAYIAQYTFAEMARRKISL